MEIQQNIRIFWEKASEWDILFCINKMEHICMTIQMSLCLWDTPQQSDFLVRKRYTAS